jgi:two-component system cell cycle sensor histidine kinase/response regulator CckA
MNNTYAHPLKTVDKHNGTILLVDDEPALRDLVAELLSDSSYRVLEARDGEHAVELLRAEGSAIALLLTDLRMPGLDGLALSSFAKQMVPSIRVLFMSGYAESVSLECALTDGASGYLQKPFTPEALYDAVESLLDVPTSPTAQNCHSTCP